MLSVILSVVSSVASNLMVRYASENYKFNVTFILLMIECLKLLICACVTRYINREQQFTIRWGFVVNALLYSVVNVLTYEITSEIEPAIYYVLIQHKLVWVVFFSLILLKKSFSLQQYISMSLVCGGCILVKMSNAKGEISSLVFSLVILQGICSSLSSVWIEKMMKSEERPKVSDNESHQKLYWFLSDSFQMYMFGIPIYLFGAFSTEQDIDIPMSLGFCLVGIGVLQGLSLGAVFVYHSSVVRSLVSAVVIVLLAAEHEVYSFDVILGISLVVLGVMGWVYKKK